MHYFYFARCADNSLYAGTCNDLKNREKVHNSGKGAKYTRQRLPIIFIYHEIFPTLSEARKREYHVKLWSKVKKENLIKYGHPTKINKSLN